MFTKCYIRDMNYHTIPLRIFNQRRTRNLSPPANPPISYYSKQFSLVAAISYS